MSIDINFNDNFSSWSSINYNSKIDNNTDNSIYYSFNNIRIMF